MVEENNPKNKNQNAKPIRTYQGDVEEILKEGEGSFAKIAIAENDKRIREGFSPEKTEENPRAKLIIGISIGLIVLGAGVLLAIYFFQNSGKTAVTASAPAPIIITDSEKTIDIQGLTRNQIINLLTGERDNDNLTLSSMANIRLTYGNDGQAKNVTAAEFLSQLQSTAPDELVRSLGDNFVFGIHALSRNQPFLILKTTYYQNAFAGMLSWEKTLRDGLGPIFILPEAPTTATTSDQVLSENAVFEDAVIKNRDVRVLRDKNGTMIFLYSFPDKNTIIITTNADTLDQVAARLLAGKLVQ